MERPFQRRIVSPTKGIYTMDYFRIGTGLVLAAAFAGALLVRNEPVEVANAAPLPPICGEDYADHGGAAMAEHMAMMAEQADEGHRALLDTMEPMHTGMMAGIMAPDFEVAFVCGMIPHHQGAVDMAKAAQHFGTDPWIKMFSQEIMTTQQQEIAEMRAWLTRKQQAVATP